MRGRRRDDPGAGDDSSTRNPSASEHHAVPRLQLPMPVTPPVVWQRFGERDSRQRDANAAVDADVIGGPSCCAGTPPPRLPRAPPILVHRGLCHCWSAHIHAELAEDWRETRRRVSGQRRCV